MRHPERHVTKQDRKYNTRKQPRHYGKLGGQHADRKRYGKQDRRWRFEG